MLLVVAAVVVVSVGGQPFPEPVVGRRVRVGGAAVIVAALGGWRGRLLHHLTRRERRLLLGRIRFAAAVVFVYVFASRTCIPNKAAFGDF